MKEPKKKKKCKNETERRSMAVLTSLFLPESLTGKQRKDLKGKWNSYNSDFRKSIEDAKDNGVLPTPSTQSEHVGDEGEPK